MEENMSAAAIDVLVQNMINAVKGVCFLTGGVDEDAQQLQTTLGNAQSYLIDAQNKSIGEEDVKIWLRTLEAVALDADNVLDEVSYHLLHNNAKKLKTIKRKDKVLSYFSSLKLNHITRPRNVALRIKQINKDLESQNKEATDLGLESKAVAAPAVAPHASFETDSFTTLDAISIERDDYVPILVEKLTHLSTFVKFVDPILAIVGMCGKTTLTRNVFDHEKMKTQFGSRIWVHVSQTFDRIILFKKIISQLTSHTSDGVESEDTVLKKLREALRGKTYLLVLDDVWNFEDEWEWYKFIDTIVATSTKRYAIMITTKSENVVSIVNPIETYRLNGLSDEDCWSIIREKTFENGQVVPSGFEMIGRNIAERCKGLPLAANVVGKVLRGKSEQDWHSMFTDDVEGDDISNILRTSFDNLPSPSLKKCFAYCSIFPKGHKIVKHELIELWMAEGFLQPAQMNDMESLRSDQMDRDMESLQFDQMDRDMESLGCFFEVLGKRMNDMESLGQHFFNVLLDNYLLLVAKRDGHGNVESSVMHDLVHDFATSVLGSSNRINRYLIHGDYEDSIPKETAKSLRTLIFQGEITDIKFSDFKCLHVLILDCNRVTELPSSISKVMHLRNLNISRTRIEYLPDSICELYQLETLNASTESLIELPSRFKYLHFLRHLYIPSHVKLPPGIGGLINLQALNNFRVLDKKGYRIEELQNLVNLKQLCIYNLENVQDNEEAQSAALYYQTNLKDLLLEWDEDREGEINDESVLAGLEPHRDLEKLAIRGFKGKWFPYWMPTKITNLIEITLSGCQGCEQIPTMGELPNLKYLGLWRLSNVTLIDSSFYKPNDWYTVEAIFPALESMLLSDMAELREWKQVEFPNKVKVFPNLRSLKIYHCKNLECLPSWLFHKAHNLKELDIRQCSKLGKLPDGLHALNSLESLIIKGCQNLKSIANPSGERGFTSLRSLEIRHCHELMTMVEPSASLLEKVSIAELKSLQNLPRLKRLEMDVSREWSSETSVAIENTVDGILQKCCSTLGELKLTGVESWKCVPKSIQHLSGLESLELENFGVEALPQWFGNLSSLTRLCLSDCAKLKHLSSMQKLEELHIQDCPELRIESERHNIFHRTSIYFSGHLL